MSCRPLLLAGTLLFFCSVAPAHADPCKAPLPAQAGLRFSGTVRYVGDGDGLCVGGTTDPNEWIEVRLADFDAPEFHQAGGAAAKVALERIALHREVTCTTERGRSGRIVSFDRVIARCRIGSDSIGDLLRQAGIVAGGN
ncbi:Micrococcal nuclease-like nuclease [Mesorhizobium plurifarium]|uniref:Micrococcal nuclease-like nuclease n=1 Tax=Mesorhizobium plurifarium TaxID=69974 RepID=A0A090E4L7_MESPL|nr:Micrococcal nuclease-like nuclease [Mesorhizobium plurifarium]